MIDRLSRALRAAREPGGVLSLPPAQPLNFRRDLAALVLLALVAAGIYLFGLRDALFSGDVTTLLARGDSHRINWAKVYILDARLRKGEFPLWDPTQLAGEPYTAHPLSMAFYPPNLLRAYVTRAQTAQEFVYSMYALLFAHLLMAMSATYLLARGEGVSIRSSFVVSLALGFSERWIVNGVYQTQEIATASWLPLNLLILRHAHRVSERRERAAWLLVAGILFGFQILAGWPQSAIYSTIAYVAFIALKAAPEYLGERVTWRGIARASRAVVAASATIGITGALVAAALVLPAREMLSASARSSQNFSAYTFSQMVNKRMPELIERQLAEIKDPTPFLKARTYGRWTQSYFSLPLAIVVVSIAALFLIGHYRVFVYCALAYVLFDLTFGPPMPIAWLLEIGAPFSLSTPWYQVALLAPILAVLAGFALDKVFELGRRGPLPWILVTPLGIAGMFAVVLGNDPAYNHAAWTFTGALALTALLALVLFGRSLRHWPALVLMALAAEIAWCANVSAHVTTEVEAYFAQRYYGPTEAITEPPLDTVRRPRVICTFCNEHVWTMESAINGFDPLVMHSALQTLSSPGTEHEYVRGAYAGGNLRELTLLRRHFWLAPAFVHGEVPPKTEAFPPTSVVYLEEAAGMEISQTDSASIIRGVVAVPSTEEELWTPPNPSRPTDQESLRADFKNLAGSGRNRALRVYYRTTADHVDFLLNVTGPRPAESFDTGLIKATPDEGGAGVIDLPLPCFDELNMYVVLMDFDPDVFSTIDRITLVEDSADEIDRIAIREAAANRMVVEVRDLPGARALVFAESNYPGWMATLDGAPARLYQANGRYQAVIVPAGTHLVEFAFRPWRVYAGVAVSVVTLILGSGFAIYLLVFRRSEVRRVEPSEPRPDRAEEPHFVDKSLDAF